MTDLDARISAALRAAASASPTDPKALELISERAGVPLTDGYVGRSPSPRRRRLPVVAALLVVAACAGVVAVGLGGQRVGPPGDLAVMSPPPVDVLGPDQPTSFHDARAHARTFLESIPLPPEPLPLALVEAQGLQARCVEHLGFPIDERLDREAVFRTGMFLHYVGDRPGAFDEASHACTATLRELGVVMVSGREANERLYDVYLESQACLADNGYPTVEPPARESFVESPLGWYPWQALLPESRAFVPAAELMTSERFGPYVASLDVCPRP